MSGRDYERFALRHQVSGWEFRLPLWQWWLWRLCFRASFREAVWGRER